MPTSSTEYKKASAAEYISWVQRALNRELGSNLKDNGAISTEYRDLVARIQQLYMLGEQGGSVDAATQNLLVELSHRRADYVWWIQAALAAAGSFTDEAPSGDFNGLTRDALYSFQSYHGLRDDSWVGPDSETWLIRISGIKPPGSYRFVKPKPKPSTGHKDNIDTTRRVEDWSSQLYYEVLNDRTRMSDDHQLRMRVLCVLQKLKKSETSGHVNTRYFDVVKVLKWVRGPARPGGLLPDSKTSLFAAFNADARDLKNQLEQFVFTLRGTHDFAAAYLAFEKRFFYYMKEIDRGLSAIQEMYAGHENVSEWTINGLHSWITAKQKDKNDICSCFTN